MLGKLLSNYPITYNSLVIESTTRCTAQCSMCYQSAGPKGSDLLGDNQLSNDVIKKVLREAINIPALRPQFHLAGGEAFIDIKSCIECFEEARKVGYLEISTTTNAYWAENQSKSHLVCRNLRQAGLTRMEISWDAWHVDFVSPNAINNCIKSAYENNIEVILRILATKQENAETAITMLDSDILPHVHSICCSPVLYSGRSVETMSRSEIFDTNNLGDACHSILNLTINPFGNVSPCCAGFDQTKTVNLGNVKNESIVDIAKRMNNSLLVRVLVFSGAGSFVPILEDAGFEIGRDFPSLCDLCWNIFSDFDKSKIIQDYFNEFQKKNNSLINS